MRCAAEGGEPFGWWGPFAPPPVERLIGDLIRAGVIDQSLVDRLSAVLSQGRSLTVVAGPSGAGKTTLLTALLALLPTDIDRRYVRGSYESFAFLEESSGGLPKRTALLVNEISQHLPIYLWGAGLRRLLESAGEDYQILATAHATGGADLIAQLAGYPLRLPARAIAALDHVLWIDAWLEDGEVRRQARSLERLAATDSGGIEVICLARRPRDAALSEKAMDVMVFPVNATDESAKTQRASSEQLASTDTAE